LAGLPVAAFDDMRSRRSTAGDPSEQLNRRREQPPKQAHRAGAYREPNSDRQLDSDRTAGRDHGGNREYHSQVELKSAAHWGIVAHLAYQNEVIVGWALPTRSGLAREMPDRRLQGSWDEPAASRLAKARKRVAAGSGGQCPPYETDAVSGWKA